MASNVKRSLGRGLVVHFGLSSSTQNDPLQAFMAYSRTRNYRRSLSKISERCMIILSSRHAAQIASILASHRARVPTMQGKVSNRIINKVCGFNRVLYDVSVKPLVTIERE
jgi:GMP synthase PP-ATPase subunit